MCPLNSEGYPDRSAALSGLQSIFTFCLFLGLTGSRLLLSVDATYTTSVLWL